MANPPNTPLVFISYRIADTKHVAVPLFRDLERELEVGKVFLDRESIDGGENWTTTIRGGVEHAQAVLVLIGNKWLTEQDKYGVRRLDDRNDWVRQEVELALQRQPRPLILPVLVDEQQPIPHQALRNIPEIQEFANLQCTQLRIDDWENDLAELLRLLKPAGFIRRDKGEDDVGKNSRFAPPSKGLFVGREYNLIALERLVDEEKAREEGQRPISLVGMGGIGKTALAGELIRRIGSRYERVIQMSRPPEGHPKKAISVFREWASDIGRSVDKEYTPAEIRRHLSDSYDSLLVLIDDAWFGDIKELKLIMNALPANATRLLTTRELNVCTELEARVYEVGPLREKDAKLLIRTQLLAAFEGRSADGAAGVDTAIAEQKVAIEEFIKKVNGHPLALRLGIGTCNSLPEIENTVRRLIESLDRGVEYFKTAELAVADGTPGLEARNRSLATSLSVSFKDMVMDDQQQGTDTVRRFKALGIFPEGCALDRAFILSVWGDERPNDAAGWDARYSLIDRCLLSVNVDTNEYWVQSVLRAFALGLLREDPAQLKAVRRRYHRVVVERATESCKSEPRLWSATDYLYPHLAHVLPELIRSLELAAESTLDTLASSVAPGSGPLERLRRDAQEDVKIGNGLSEGFRYAASRRPEWGDTGVRLLKLGLLCARADEDHNEEAEFLGRLGDRYTSRDSQLAEEYFAAALDVARKHKAPTLGKILTFYAESRRTRSDWAGALEFAKEALDIHADARNDLREAKTRLIMGEVFGRMSRLDDADEQYTIAFEIYKRRRNDKGEADVLNLMASNEFARGDRYKQAIVLFEEALKIHTKLNDLGMKAQDLNDMGACYRYLGEYKKAEGLFNKALDLNQLIGNRRLEAFNTCNIAGALFAQKQYDLAQSRAEEGCRIGKEVEDKVPQLWGLVWKGLALQGMGEFKTAETSFNECVQLGREMENPRGLAGALGRLGVLLFDELDRADEGKSLIQEAIKILRDHNLKTAFSNITLDELEERLEHTSH